MTRMPKVLLVIPCYNEAERLPAQSFIDFSAEHPDISFLFVNDGSTDHTQGVIDGLSTLKPAQFSSLALERNLGKAGAVRLGMLEAVKGDAEYIGFWDADLSTPLDEISRFVHLYQTIPDTIMLAGSRVKLMGRSIRRRASRHYLGRIFATVASMLLDIEMYDTQCGAKLFRRSRDTERLFLQPFHSRWLFDLELILRIRNQVGAPGRHPMDTLIHEVPLNTWRDVSGSRIPYPYFFWAFFDLLSLRLRYPR
jgi:dolichyl-phosphate beta-glucosyltransferase